jgi:hypothetical protein
VLASLPTVDFAAGVLEINDFFSIAMMDPSSGIWILVFALPLCMQRAKLFAEKGTFSSL